ncbi:MAG: peptidylprolyl isomerase [Flavobacteriaceae bacterium]|jgi:peptidyl-prolyl cis-trans isomerase D|nr:peptidylprolyl isomerase [Flavobacteriaceae bacterium]
MAVLNNIRKHGIFLIIIIALALFSFVLSGVIGNGNTVTKGESIVATINGVELPREDFMKKVEVVQRSLGPNAPTNQAMNIVWDRELRRVILDEQYESLGLSAEKAQISNSLKTALASNPAFQNELGAFSDLKMQEYIASIKAAAKTGNTQAYSAWLDFENSTVNTILEKNYFNLINGGLTTTLAEGKQEYHFQNDNIDIEFLEIPYAKIADADVVVTDKEIETYVRAHSKDYEVAPQVDIQYVSFLENPSEEDNEITKIEISKLLPDFATTDDISEFVNANSDVTYSDRWYLKNDLPVKIADDIMVQNFNEIYGPYKDNETYNIARVFETKKMADSAKAKHILIRFYGLSTAPQDVVRTKESAKKLADSILKVIKRNATKFDVLAAEFSEDLSNKDKGGDLGYFSPGRMVKPFNDYIFDNKTGDIGVVETDYGFHVIEIDDQKNIQKAVKIALIVKKIEASEKTINDVFSKATKFEIAAKNADFSELAKEGGLSASPVNKIGELDANIPGVGENRSIVTWAFNKDTNIGDVKRFNTTNGYVIAQLTRRNPKGLKSIAEASATVTPILRNEKKAKLIRESISSTDIKKVASNQNLSTKTANAITMANPTIAGSGTEPKVIGTAFGLKLGETSKLIDGVKGVFMVKVTAVNNAPEIQDYSAFANRLNTSSAASIDANAFNALKNKADIDDNRAAFY